MEVSLKFPDSAYSDDKVGYDRFFAALQAMLDRIGVSHFKYQHKAVPPTIEAATEPIDMMATLRQRLMMYDGKGGLDVCDCEAGQDILRVFKPAAHESNCRTRTRPMDTGNTEWLLDTANQAVIEFLFPKHAKAHFRATDSKESPGLAYKE